MSFSSFAKEVLGKALNYSSKGKSKQDNNVEYLITFTSSRDDPDIAEMRFIFKKPIKESTINGNEFTNLINKYIDQRQLGIIDNILFKYGLQSVGSKNPSKESGSINIPYDNQDTIKEEEIEALPTIRLVSGRFISIAGFTALLSLRMRENMMAHMTSPGPQLHNRTGRFIATSNIDLIRVGNVLGKKTLQVFYDYKRYPYETFDPDGPNSLGLASEARNPRRIIGEAIIKSIQELADPSYKIEVTLT
jgi:hypothetical protein